MSTSAVKLSRDRKSGDSQVSSDDEYGDGTTTPMGETEVIADEPGEVESDSGKLKQLLGILRKVVGVKDLANMRLSLPASLLTPVGNLEFWHYLDRPDLFAAIGENDLDQLTRFLAVVRWTFSKELRYVRQRVCKPYNSALGEQFRCAWEVSPASPHEFIVYHDVYDGPPEGSAPPSAKSSPALSATKGSLPKNMSNLSLSETLNNNHKRKLSKGTSSSASSVANLPTASATGVASTSSGSKSPADETCRVAFLNEQVSHHPPISAFWYESTPGEGRAAVQASGVDQIAAKFNGTSVRIGAGSQNKGIFVQVPSVTEDEYHITHPGAYITGFLSGSPYIVMSDHTYISTLRSDTNPNKDEKRYRAIIQYNEESWITKPKFLIEGVVYETSDSDAEYTKIKQVPETAVVARLKGSWKGRITIKKKGEKTESTLLDLSQLEVVPKSVRPVEKQDEMETRKFWEPVTNSIVKKDYKKATAHKQTIEQAQRDKAAKRKEDDTPFEPILFDADISEGRGKLTERGREALKQELELHEHAR